MHELRDENGNLIPHSGHDHENGCEHSQHCGSCGQDSDKCKDETLALLTYMIQHNEHHAAEIDQMADNLEKTGMSDVAKQMKEGVSQFQKGNMYLNLALSLYKEHKKEA